MHIHQEVSTGNWAFSIHRIEIVCDTIVNLPLRLMHLGRAQRKSYLWYGLSSDISDADTKFRLTRYNRLLIVNVRCRKIRIWFVERRFDCTFIERSMKLRPPSSVPSCHSWPPKVSIPSSRKTGEKNVAEKGTQQMKIQPFSKPGFDEIKQQNCALNIQSAMMSSAPDG